MLRYLSAAVLLCLCAAQTPTPEYKPPEISYKVSTVKHEPQMLVYIHAVGSILGSYILEEYMEQLRATNLYHAAGRIFVGVLGAVQPLAKVFETFPKLELLFVSAHMELMEFPTLHMLHLHAKQTHPQSTILYMHTKGVNRRQYAENWRKMHTFCIVENWVFCQRVMKEGFDSVGCNLQDYGEWHYSGNFWWATASFVSKQPPIDAVCQGCHRVDAEMWLLRGQHIPNFWEKHYCIYHSHRNMYDKATNRTEYTSLSLETIRPTGQCPPPVVNLHPTPQSHANPNPNPTNPNP